MIAQKWNYIYNNWINAKINNHGNINSEKKKVNEKLIVSLKAVSKITKKSTVWKTLFLF